MYKQNWGHQCPPHICPPKTLPTQYDPGQISPTKQYVSPILSNEVVSHVHPSHNTTVNQHLITHKHYFPHTESVVNVCKEQHIMCGAPYNPCCSSRPFGF